MSAARLLRTTAFRQGAVYVALFGVAVVVLFAFLYWRTLSLIDSETDAAITSEITALNDQYQQQGLVGLIRIVTERAEAHADGGNLYLLTQPDLTRLAGNLERWPAEARQTPAGIVFDIVDEEGGALRARARTFVLEGNNRLLVGRDLRQRANLRNLIAETLAWGLAATIGFGLMGALLVGRNLLSRVDAINRTGQRIVRGEMQQRVALTGAGDEFDRLAENLNSMLDQIERLMTGMREVTDNIAHDLRGPLTRMKARLELALLGQQDPAQQRAAIDQAIAETDRLLSTFNALLAIAEAESGAVHQTMQSIDLVKLAEDVAELYEPALEERGLALETRLEPCPSVTGVRQLLFQALSNLLENAMKYTPEGGTVVIATQPDGAGAAISVADTGPGVPAELREKVLQRYVRLDAARSTPGSGLGLSLVAAVAKLHGARLALGDHNPGLVVTIAFPHGIKADVAAGPAAQPVAEPTPGKLAEAPAS
ncbi:MAG: HAMP domain-containing histidine kinase [Alphaproteobacteria bacterium]|nr:HAMP domain-containing histidine kinase [Alphaproteobacteria bacterium]